MHVLLRLFLLVSLAAVAPAQRPYAVGVRDLGFPNTTGRGTANLACRVHYPAATAGRDVPILARQDGWPVVVFLHGFAALGRFYGGLGDALAAAGYVAVMSDTAQFANATQADDGRALLPALLTANASGPFAGALATDRIGLAGHSMGGGNVGNVLATERRYVCGFAFAPVTPTGNNAAAIAQPLAILVGEGDTITPWRQFSEPFFAGVTANRGIASLTLLNGDADHSNVTGLFVSGGIGAEVFASSVAVAVGFFDRWLDGRAEGLEAVLGVGARAEPRLVELRVRVADPDLWTGAAIRPGAVGRVSVAAEPGTAGVLGAAGLASIPTPFGRFGLDPATAFIAFEGVAGVDRRFDANVALPADPSLIGARLPVQAFGAARGAALRLGVVGELVVLP